MADALIPGAVHKAAVTISLPSSMGPWKPVAGATAVDLLGEGFTLGRDLTGTYYSLFYDAALDQGDYDSRRDFIRQYRGWPIVVRGSGVNAYTYLHNAESEVPNSAAQVFGEVQMYVREQYDGTQSSATSGSVTTFSQVEALRDRENGFPAVGEEPMVTTPATEEDLEYILKVESHEIFDAVRSADDSVLISSQEVVEGTISIAGAFTAPIGGDITLSTVEGAPTFKIARLNRVGVLTMAIRLERDVE